MQPKMKRLLALQRHAMILCTACSERGIARLRHQSGSSNVTNNRYGGSKETYN